MVWLLNPYLIPIFGGQASKWSTRSYGRGIWKICANLAGEEVVHLAVQRGTDEDLPTDRFT